MKRADKIKIAISLVAVVLFVTVSLFLFRLEQKRRQDETYKELYNEYLAPKSHPIGEYATVDDVAADTIKWLDRYEGYSITRSELNTVLWDLMTEAQFFPGDTARDLWADLLDLSSDTVICRTEKDFLYEVDRFRRKWE